MIFSPDDRLRVIGPIQAKLFVDVVLRLAKLFPEELRDCDFLYELEHLGFPLRYRGFLLDELKHRGIEWAAFEGTHKEAQAVYIACVKGTKPKPTQPWTPEEPQRSIRYERSNGRERQ